MDAPDEMVEAVAQAIWEHDGPFLLWRQLTEPVKDVSRERARAALSVPALAEVIARDAKVREIAADAVWLAKLAQGSSWPGEMADRVQRAADRVVSELGSDADRAAIAALRQLGSE